MKHKKKIKCEKCLATIAYDIGSEVEVKCRSCGHLNIVGERDREVTKHL